MKKVSRLLLLLMVTVSVMTLFSGCGSTEDTVSKARSVNIVFSDSADGCTYTGATLDGKTITLTNGKLPGDMALDLAANTEKIKYELTGTDSDGKTISISTDLSTKTLPDNGYMIISSRIKNDDGTLKYVVSSQEESLLTHSVNSFTDKIDGYVWGWVLIILILGVGLVLTIRSRLVQVFHLGKALKFMVKNENDGVGEVTSFGALCTALSATIGTGNIVGVATAICAGGPGALLWMLIAAFFGMATKYAEGLLAVKFRDDDGKGHFLGGPFYYIEKGLGSKWKWLAKLFAIFGTIAGILGIGTITQINGITSSIKNVFDPDTQNIAFTIGGTSYSWAIVIGGILVTAMAAIVIIGGIKRIAKVSEIVVPFMAIMYVLFSLILIICNITKIPAAVSLVCRSAFAPQAVLGAAAGITIKIAMQKGIGRGIFSNEAGLGSAPIAAAAAKTKDCVRQGLVTMTGTFIDTIIICTMTGLSIVLTGAWEQIGFEGVEVTNYAWEQGLPWNPEISSFVLMLCLVFFAFTTILGWDYYSERCLEYLVRGKKFEKAGLLTFRVLYIVAVFVGPYLTVSAVWNIADIFNGLMAFPNLVALLLLSGVVARETKDFIDRQKSIKGVKK